MIKYPLNVTIDTNIFEANQFNFGTDSTMSLLVKNVQNGKIKLVLSNIVISEVEKHICQRVDSICGKARKLRKEYLDILPEQYLTDIGMGLYVQIPEKEPIHQSAKEVFEKFLDDCKVERLDTSSIKLEEILDNYFAVLPPFENSEKKRKEFPDAFIAEEIKQRFGNDEIVAIISQDKGFKKACCDSKNHLFFSSLGELYNTLSKNEEEYDAAFELIMYNGITGIRSEYLDEADAYKAPKRIHWKRWIAAAACICLMMCAAIPLFLGKNISSPFVVTAYTFTFPLFMLTYIPISLVALFCKTEWKPIKHTVTAQQFEGKLKQKE